MYEIELESKYASEFLIKWNQVAYKTELSGI